MKFLLFLVLSAVPQSSSTSQPAISQEIVVTASGIPESVEQTPASVTVITREQIEQRAARDVAEVLREVPGLSVARTGSPGKITTLFSRGGSSKTTLVLWNSIELNDPSFSGYDWGHFSTAGVERIEIVRGPFSALYGSEAVAGVVHVVTTPARPRRTADLQQGERGLFNGNIAAAWSAQRWDFSSSYEHRQDDGFAPNDDFEQDAVLGSATWKSDRLSLGLQGRYTRYDLGIPRSTNAAGTAFEPRLRRRERGEEFQASLPVRYSVGGSSYELTVSRSQRHLDFEDPQDPFGRFQAENESDTDRVQLKATVPTRLGRLVGGAEHERSVADDASTYGVSLDSQSRSSRSAFLEDRLSLRFGSSQLELALGARYDHYDTFGSEVSPRVGAAWIVGRNKLRAAYGRAFRAPAIGELYFPFFGNPELEAERSRSMEAGYDRFFRSGGSVSISLFDSEFENLIVFGTSRFENIGVANSRGVELGLNAPVSDRLSVAFSYTGLDTEDEATGDALLRRPKHAGSVALWYRRGAFGGGIVMYHTGRRTDVTDLFPFGRVMNEPYTVADLKVDYQLGDFVPYVKIENGTDEQYQEVFGYPSPRRRVIAGVRWSR